MVNVLKYVKSICVYFFIVLFVYAAISKLVDFENFQVQVAQSPLLSAFATPIAYSVVVGELIIALLLCFQTTKALGFYLFLGFMTAFTVYIYLILHYSPFVPCSCGGILEKMGWWEHLWFNIITTIVAVTLLLHNNTTKQTILFTTIAIVISTAIVVILFISSEHIMKKENPFVRRFLPHPISDVQGLELPYNSYYLAGFVNDTLYLGNYTAPLHGLISTTKPKIVDTLTLSLENFTQHQFSSIKWTLYNDSLFLNDYTLPLFYKGAMKAKELIQLQSIDSLSYSLATPISQNSYVLRTFNKNKSNVGLSILNTSTKSFIKHDHILEETNQPQDLFSNDGILLYNQHLNKTIYVFYYKNRVLTFDATLANKQVLQTIDTISTPNFKVEYLPKQQQLKMNTNAIKVHKMAATSGNYLYIASDRIGKNESSTNYNTATIIDVYRLADNTYQYSFYFYHYRNTVITQLQVYDNYIIGIGKNKLSIAKFKKSVYD